MFLTELQASEILRPLSPMPCGEDGRYHDDFVAAKREVEKLSGADYDLIITSCVKVLSSVGKDVRAANYLLLGICQQEGLEGLVQGISLLNKLLLEYGESLFPERKTAMQAALRWLDQARFVELIKQKPIIPEHVIELQQEIDLYEQHVAKLLQDSTVQLGQLRRWASNYQATSVKKNQTVESSRIDETNTKIDSAEEAQQVCHSVIEYYQSVQQWYSAVALARVLRWGEINIPAATNGKTMLPPPHNANIARLTAHINTAEPEKLLSVCEEMFLQEGGKFWFDLQYYAYRAATDMGQKELAEYLMNQLCHLLAQHPQLIDLEFANAQAFASEITKTWLRSALDETPLLTVTGSPQSSQDPMLLVNSLSTRHVEKGFSEIFETADGTNKEKFKALRAAAQFALRCKKLEIADRIYAVLDDLISTHCLHEWDVSLVTPVWIEMVRFYRQYSAKLADSDQAKIRSKLQVINQALCKVDINQALKVMV